jgi:hypothetical protein
LIGQLTCEESNLENEGRRRNPGQMDQNQSRGPPWPRAGGHFAGQRGQPSRSAAPPSPRSFALSGVEEIARPDDESAPAYTLMQTGVHLLGALGTEEQDQSQGQRQPQSMPTTMNASRGLAAMSGALSGGSPVRTTPESIGTAQPNTVSRPPADVDAAGSSMSFDSEGIPQPTRARMRLQSGIFKPRVYTDSTIRYSCFAATGEPQVLSEALDNANWRHAVDVEFQALQNNKTWHLVPYRSGANIIDSKWVYKIKRKASIDRYKACLVAKGFKQRYVTIYTVIWLMVIRKCGLYGVHEICCLYCTFQFLHATLPIFTLTDTTHISLLSIHNDCGCHRHGIRSC